VSEHWSEKKALAEDFDAYLDSHLRLGRDALPAVRRADQPRPHHVAPIVDVLQSKADGRDMRKAVENLSRTDSPSAVLALREALLNESVEVRSYAANILTKLEERLAFRVKRLQEEMANGTRTGPAATLETARAFFDYAYYHVAEDVFRPQYLQETVAHARKARELGAGAPALLLEGRALLCLERYEEAENRFTQFLQERPHDSKALLWRAEARFRLARYPGVREDCESTLREGGVPPAMAQVAELWAAPVKAQPEKAAGVQVA
jgi:tetratricopeptide (TPR) repeat protein